MTDVRFSKERLIKGMKEKGIGNTELARIVGVSRQMIFYLRTGQRQTASAEIITKIAAALDMSIHHLMGDDEEQEEELPDVIKQLAQVTGKLSETRQDELLRIAEALERMEREQVAQPLPPALMRVLVELAEQMRQQGDNEDVLTLLEALLRRRPGGWFIDLRPPQDRDQPGEDN